MPMKRNTITLILILICCGGSLLKAQSSNSLSARANRLHFSSIVLDTHVDVTPNLQKEGWKFTDEHGEGHVDLPRMKKGGLNALFFSIWMPGTVTGPKAVNDAVERIAAVHQLARDLPDKVALCVTAEEVRRAHKQGKIGALIGMEGGHMINNSLPILRMYARIGVRYLTLTHGVHTDWADSSGEDPKHNGLTPLGKEIVRELNRLGVIVDISHVSDKTFWDALEVSKAPMIASHSSCRSLANHPRNMTDEMIKALAAKGGVIQIAYLDGFIDENVARYYVRVWPRLRDLMARYPAEGSFDQIWKDIEKEYGARPKASWERIIDHIDHAVKLVGVDHVGLGSDFDGGDMPEGMKDVTQLPKITEALLRRGYSESAIKKILGENTLRVMEQVERVASGGG